MFGSVGGMAQDEEIGVMVAGADGDIVESDRVGSVATMPSQALLNLAPLKPIVPKKIARRRLALRVTSLSAENGPRTSPCTILGPMASQGTRASTLIRYLPHLRAVVCL